MCLGGVTRLSISGWGCSSLPGAGAGPPLSTSTTPLALLELVLLPPLLDEEVFNLRRLEPNNLERKFPSCSLFCFCLLLLLLLPVKSSLDISLSWLELGAPSRNILSRLWDLFLAGAGVLSSKDWEDWEGSCSCK